MKTMEQKKISKSVLKRLPGYLAYLKNMPEDAPIHISATALANALVAEPGCIHRLAYQGTAGNPVLFPRSTFSELCNLPEGKGGGAVVKMHPELVRFVEVSDPRELVDVDTPEILQSLLET